MILLSFPNRMACNKCGTGMLAQMHAFCHVDGLTARPRVPGASATVIGEDVAKQSKGLFSANDWQCAQYV